jgi:hypothetical protein
MPSRTFPALNHDCEVAHDQSDLRTARRGPDASILCDSYLFGWGFVGRPRNPLVL